MQVWPGARYPLGATYDGTGTNFAISSQVADAVGLCLYELDAPDRMSHRDSARFMPKGVVVNPYFDWGSDSLPRVPYHHTIVYEAHVKGLTMRHPGIPEELRGTYAAIGHPVIVDYLRRLGVTAIELMPVHQFVDDHRLV